MKRILIADDHQVVRKGLRQILSDEFLELELGEAENAQGVFKNLSEKKWDILILDINMPGRSGLEVLKQIKDDKIFIPVLVLSMHAEEQIALRALKSGAWGYLSKDAADTELIKAIHQILDGRRYITPSLAEQLAEQIENPSSQVPHDRLSCREYQTLMLISLGKTISEIAEELSLSVPTISTYRARILEKMGMKTNAQLTRYAIRNNLS